MNHPSHLALDRFALGDAPADVARHVETCEACQGHVAAAQVALPRPAWLDDVARPRPARWRLGVLALAGGLAVVLAVVARPGGAGDEVRSKGVPAATVWLKRGDRVSAWQGAPLKAGDSIRLEVAPAGFAHLTVVQLEPSPHILYAASPGAAGTTLTPAWTLVGEGVEERLAIILSRQPLGEDALTPALARRDDEAYTLEVRLPREQP